ncbi:hypothetical protein [Marinicella litoralis]|uniref:Uncharacterized protein n=1 Tax=Marinicella litoralis TaxID=644220 RepID=A0A4R6XAH6_9GAMM|nr:hypothetical protein [Marinicella litoralis]TDR14630.1 hypothetical protein C8D91_2938 [Marinicella litoralis]
MTDLILCSIKENKFGKIKIRFDGKAVNFLKDLPADIDTTNGWYENFETGVFKKETVLICVFSYQKEMYISFDDKAYKEKDLKFRRYFIFTRIKKFKAYFKGECVKKFNYIYRYLDDHPLDESDFLYELDSIKKNTEQKNNLLEIWNTGTGQTPLKGK